jgi:hypothetical protein
MYVGPTQIPMRQAILDGISCRRPIANKCYVESIWVPYRQLGCCTTQLHRLELEVLIVADFVISKGVNRVEGEVARSQVPIFQLTSPSLQLKLLF